MLPRRIYLKGFMSYRDEVTVSFADAPLWVLAGSNGSGKSSIFDAITFALYGVHRGGNNQNHAVVINNQCDGAVVRFDFVIGDKEYRIKRSLTFIQGKRNSSPKQTFQAFERTNTEDDDHDGKPISETDRSEGLKRWVLETVGLNAEAFTASVLLRQGANDVLISASKEERYQILKELVDLEAYVKLQKKAADLAKDADGSRKAYEAQLGNYPEVKEEELIQLECHIQELDSQIDQLNQQLDSLNDWIKDAERWEDLLGKREALNAEISTSQELLRASEDIECNANRQSELRTVLPTLERLLQANNALGEILREIGKFQKKADEHENEAKILAQELAQADNHNTELHQQQEKWRNQAMNANNRIAELTPAIVQLNSLDQERKNLQQVQQEVSDFPKDLDDQLKNAKQKLDELNNLKNILPWLESLAKARTSWRDTNRVIQTKQADLVSITNELEAVEQQRTDIANQLAGIAQVVNEKQAALSDAKAHLTTIASQIKRFNMVDGEQKCSYCGQDLAPEHLEQERQRLDTEHRFATQVYDAANKACSETKTQQLAIEKESIKQQTQKENLSNKKRDLESVLNSAVSSQNTALQLLVTAVENLPQEFRAKIVADDKLVPEIYVQSVYPTSEDLAALKREAAQISSQEQIVANLEGNVQQREVKITEQRVVNERITSLEEQYPLEKAELIRSEYALAEKECKVAKLHLEELLEPLKLSDQNLKDVTVKLAEAKEAKQQASNKKEKEEVRVEEIIKGITELKANLTPEWRAIAESLQPSQLEHWQIELQSLEGADKKLEELRNTPQKIEFTKEQLKLVENDLAQIPVEAQKPSSELLQQSESVSDNIRKAREIRDTYIEQKGSLETRRKMHNQLEDERQKAAKQHRLYSKLAKYLGRDYLQQQLLQQAKNGIVEYANEILDRISGGALQLDLEQGERTEKNEALDLWVSDRNVGVEKQPVQMLSGSQKFRVSVSLALGIGKYVNHKARPIEAVIIDEGFGSLDKQGREEMVEELRRLKDDSILKTIILVSHQEEFWQAFDNGYRVFLDSGASRVTPLEGVQ